MNEQQFKEFLAPERFGGVFFLHLLETVPPIEILKSFGDARLDDEVNILVREGGGFRSLGMTNFFSDNTLNKIIQAMTYRMDRSKSPRIVRYTVIDGILAQLTFYCDQTYRPGTGRNAEVEVDFAIPHHNAGVSKKPYFRTLFSFTARVEPPQESGDQYLRDMVHTALVRKIGDMRPTLRMYAQSAFQEDSDTISILAEAYEDAPETSSDWIKKRIVRFASSVRTEEDRIKAYEGNILAGSF